MSTVVKDLGAVSAYAYAVEKGYTGTEAEFAELMADYAEVGQRAEDAADSALESKTAAQTAATTATNKASEAATSATTATTAAEAAQADADAAALDASQALSAASTATSKASEATTAAATAVSAKDDAVSANTAAQSAKTAAQTAQTGAETAAASVSASAAQITQNTSDISELKEELTALAPKEDAYKAFPTDTASGAIASFADGANVPVKSLVVNIDPVQEGSGDPSPTNVRPISGWSEVNVEHTGANVWDEEWTICSIDWSTYIFTPAQNGRFTSKNYIPVVPNRTYYANLDTMNTVIAGYTDVSGSGGRNITVNNHTDKLLTIPSDVKYIKFGISGYGTTYNNDISINYPSTDHDYHPYDGQSINIALGQTVYGGTLDVTKGELVIDRTMVDLGTLSWNYSGGIFYSTSAPLFGKNGSALVGDKARNICEIYKNATVALSGPINGRFNVANVQDTPILRLSDDRFTDASTFKTASIGIKAVVELVTPFTISLTPHEVTALLGSNNIWADTGDSAVEYRADPTLYIQRLTEPDADMVADANITSGQYFMVGNTLYKATANIASGGAITPNVNCTRKSLSEALNEINA